jgi:hypothetical protein
MGIVQGDDDPKSLIPQTANSKTIKQGFISSMTERYEDEAPQWGTYQRPEVRNQRRVLMLIKERTVVTTRMAEARLS